MKERETSDMYVANTVNTFDLQCKSVTYIHVSLYIFDSNVKYSNAL